MMKKLLFTLSLITVLNVSAQTETIDIEWGFDSNPTADGNLNSSRTIEVGDTVTWTWVGNGNHNVQSNEDNSATNAESFSSGATVPAPNTFSYTFNVIGSTDYECNPHSTFMLGTITVVAEGTLSSPVIEDPAKFTIYPNPGSEFINISIPKNINESLNLEVFDVLGKLVFKQQLNNLTSKINISKWNSGIYLVRLSTSDDAAKLTKRFVKL